jgi:hypothetical protein
VSAACAQFAFTSVGGQDLIVLVPYDQPEGQPCPSDGYVLLDPAQAQQVLSVTSGGGDPSTSFPSPEDAAAAWGIGFVMVVGCYVIARSVGAVVNFINGK